MSRIPTTRPAGARVARPTLRSAALRSIVLLLATAATAAAASAQSSSSASVTAVVQQPIAVTKTSDLAFGAVFPGLTKTVAVTDVGAAAFAIQAQAGANINVTFALPSTITSGAASLPITAWTARRTTTSSPVSGTDFVPGSAATSAVISATGALYVYLGATAQPTAAQAAGTYSGTATITVVYF